MAERVAYARGAGRVLDYLSLCKPLIGLLAAATSCAGFLSFRSDLPAALVVGAGVFLLSCGAGVLNNCQDRIPDGRLRRTAHRPLVTNRIRLRHAYLFSVTMIGFGLMVLWEGSHSLVVMALAMGCLIIYNGLYTPLKQRTLFAFVPGSICGLLCPLLGWAAAGGSMPTRPFILFLAIVVTWQFPHFFLISLIHRDDLVRSRLPSLFQRFTVSVLEHWVVLWLLSYTGLTLFLHLVGTVQAGMGTFILLINGFGLILSATIFLFRPVRLGMYRLLRNQLGISQVLVTMLVITQGWRN